MSPLPRSDLQQRVRQSCLHCIQSGEASRALGVVAAAMDGSELLDMPAEFSDAVDVPNDVPRHVVEEINRRIPGFTVLLQQQSWLYHCGDGAACVAARRSVLSAAWCPPPTPTTVTDDAGAAYRVSATYPNGRSWRPCVEGADDAGDSPGGHSQPTKESGRRADGWCGGGPSGAVRHEDVEGEHRRRGGQHAALGDESDRRRPRANSGSDEAGDATHDRGAAGGEGQSQDDARDGSQ